jgi:hypothetical protein
MFTHFAADRVVVVGCVVSLQSARHALGWYGLCFASKFVLLGQTYGSSVEKAKELATLWGQLGERLGRNLEEADFKFQPITPPFPTKCNHRTIRNDGNIGSV